jgi:diguanylate cyclase (GGDEF)-like protein
MEPPVELLEVTCGIAIGVVGVATICLALRFTSGFGFSYQRSASRFLLLAIGFFSLSEFVDGVGQLLSFGTVAEGLFVVASESAEVSVIACAVLAAYFLHKSAVVEVATLRRSAGTDSLTGLANHGTFQGALGRAFRDSKGRKTPLSCAMIDVDDFKAYNDRYGHEAGNEVLRRVSGVLKGSTRAGDLAARYGGEEFVVLLACPSKEASEFAERVRSDIERECTPARDPGVSRRVTVSVGVATLCDRTRHPAELVEAADREMYRSKGAGKNSVSVAA